MNIWEMENAVQLGAVLKEAGFEVSQVCNSRLSCFDLAAKKQSLTLLLKIASEVDSVSYGVSRELKIIAGNLSASALLISQHSHGKPLEDDTVYSRNGVIVINAKTIKSIIEQTGNPLIYASPGGYTVKIDGALIESRRKELGLSIGQLASIIGVSRRTLYGYERGINKATVISAYKLAETLGIPVAKPINVLAKTTKQPESLLFQSKHDLMTKILLRQLFRKFSSCDISPIHHAPFDFIMKIPKENYLIIGGVASTEETDLESRVKEILIICRAIYAYPVLIAEKSNNHHLNLCSFSVKDLRVIRSPEELIVSV